MRIKSTISALGLMSFVLMALGGIGSLLSAQETQETQEAPEEKQADAMLQNHAAIAENVGKLLNELAKKVSGLSNAQEAKAYTDVAVPAACAKLKDCVEASKTLPAPTDEEKAAFDKAMQSAGEKYGQAAMGLAFKVSQNSTIDAADAEALKNAALGLQGHKEMAELMKELFSTYESSKKSSQ